MCDNGHPCIVGRPIRTLGRSSLLKGFCLFNSFCLGHYTLVGSGMRLSRFSMFVFQLLDIIAGLSMIGKMPSWHAMHEDCF